MMDFHGWKKRPTPQLVQFLKSSNFDSDEEEEHLQEKRINDEVKVLTSAGSNVPLATPVAISTTLPPSVSALSQQGSDSKLAKSGQASGSRSPGVSSGLPVQPTAVGELTTTVDVSLPVPGSVTLSTASSTSAVSSSASSQLQIHLSKNVTQPLSIKTTQSLKTPLSSPGSGTTVKLPKSPPLSPRQHTRQQSISAVYDISIGSQEAIVERAKQEAQVMQRVAEMRKEGLWSSRRLPKVQEPPRNKAHWDYLLEEMQWLATDFVQERKWKKAACRKIARMVAKYHQEQEQKEMRAEKEEALKLKRIANQMSKIVKEFWSNIEKVVQYKQQSRMEERKKKALDVHLNFIVDQTEKYSSWLTETLHCGSSSVAPSVNGSVSSPAQSSEGDNEFEPIGTATDDEETIEKEENESGIDDEATKKELEELQKESELPIEDLLKTLPEDVLDRPAVLPDSDSSSEEEKASDDEFKANQEADDVEDTIEEQEEHEKKDTQNELNDLQAEGEMSMEELVKKYAGAYDSDFEMPEDSEDETTDGDDEESEESAKESSSSEEEEEEEEEADDASKMESDVGLDYLLKPQTETEEPKPETPSVPVKVEESKEAGPGKEITDIAAEALSLQPKGYTLETTEVKTTVPFLLKHTLREYQHVGLDWLATMYSKRLNGILADEMGLGKTIQTISVLAHLACEKGVWGPHLIVVPTSVMLNWEIELKKWCPAFKILTYYGSQKERKQKRQGWTKTNAFHVCITSYKIVIQDHAAFRRKKWKYLILDEAQNIKNFKSQRWQMLLNFQSQRRLLLTGTPLQNSLMELWSLMHFLMPHVFQSHKEFKEWFANPLTGMVEGSQDYNDSLVKRLHKVLRPFLLRRLKDDVEKQMPRKYEHVVMCKLSKRQRYLYDEFMGQTKTRETLNSGDFLSVINVLMQLRKVCNHPNLFDPRPIVSPFQMEGLVYTTASMVLKILQYDPFKEIDIRCLYPSLAEMELNLPAFVAHRVQNLQTPGKLIEEIDDYIEPTPKLKPGRLKNFNFNFPNTSPAVAQVAPGRASPLAVNQQRSSSPLTVVRLAQPVSRSETPPTNTSQPISTPQPVKLNVVNQTSSATSGNKLSLLTSSPSVSTSTSSPVTTTLQNKVLPQQIQGLLHTSGTSNVPSQPITVQIQQTEQGTRLMIPTSQFSQLPAGLIQIVQTGQQLIATSSSSSSPVQSTAPVLNTTSILAGKPVVVPSTGVTTVGSTSARVVTPVTSQVKTTVQLPVGTVTSSSKPVMRVTPLTTSVPTPDTASTTAASKNLASLSTVTAAQAASAIAAVKTTEPVSTPASTTPAPTPPTVPVGLTKRPPSRPAPQSELHLKSLKEKREKHRKAKLELIAKMNKRHCDVQPVYGSDLCEAVNVLNDRSETSVNCNRWHGLGLVHCHNVHTPLITPADIQKHNWQQTTALSDMVHTPEGYLSELRDVLERYVFVTPAVTTPSIQMHVSHPPPSHLVAQRHRDGHLKHQLSSLSTCLHPISSKMQVVFPELRLIQYDCGKLQTLDRLLAKLKTGSHRVLIFTQMTKMLDVLEAFLNYHGHRYLRLDGTTRVEQRQVLMDRFNGDKRIFVFILSTRSGGIGVNLTGADTVIFYDSDWNPTMDAQAQDRCHRIGQTRDVHIYRLISDKTIEENILKKANQKRLLGDLAIEGGNFTTAFFKQQTLKELFEEPSGLQSLADEKNQSKEVVEKVREVETPARNKPEANVKDANMLKQFEMALCKAEDETDVIAAKQVQAEQKAELAEFDESIPWDEKESESKKEEEEVSKVELELAQLEKELTPVERYAVQYVEAEMEPEEDSFDEEDIENSKKEWELARLKALKEEEERRAEMEEDEMLYTYSVDDSHTQVKKKKQKSKKARSDSSFESSAEVSTTKQRASERSRGVKKRVTSDTSEDGGRKRSTSNTASKNTSPKTPQVTGERRSTRHPSGSNPQSPTKPPTKPPPKTPKSEPGKQTKSPAKPKVESGKKMPPAAAKKVPQVPKTETKTASTLVVRKQANNSNAITIVTTTPHVAATTSKSTVAPSVVLPTATPTKDNNNMIFLKLPTNLGSTDKLVAAQNNATNRNVFAAMQDLIRVSPNTFIRASQPNNVAVPASSVPSVQQIPKSVQMPKTIILQNPISLASTSFCINTAGTVTRITRPGGAVGTQCVTLTPAQLQQVQQLNSRLPNSTRPILRVPLVNSGQRQPMTIRAPVRLPTTCIITSPRQRVVSPRPSVVVTPANKDAIGSPPQPWSNPNLVIRTRRASQQQDPLTPAPTASPPVMVNMATMPRIVPIQNIQGLNLKPISSQTVTLTRPQIIQSNQLSNFVVVGQKKPPATVTPQPNTNGHSVNNVKDTG